MHPAQRQRSFSPTAAAQHQGALIQHKILPKCYVIGGVSGSGKRDELAVVACSALKQKYRDILSGQVEHSEHPSKDVLTQRVQQRTAEGTHFMPASLLESQLALMEVDSSAYRYDAQPPSAIVDDLVALRGTESH
ncbi:MAG: gluconate kinase [Trebouxia sp. A1-2]|nr:MAG: gluconate kinase [Trebouxia sp. A1-2]